jgi:single-strand DNA-binding protein
MMKNEKDKKGEKVTKTEWHNCVAINKQAEIIEKYVTKGHQIYIEGKLTYNKFENEGKTKYITEIQINEFRFIGKKESDSQPSYKHQEIGPTSSELPPSLSNGDYDNMPF